MKRENSVKSMKNYLTIQNRIIFLLICFVIILFLGFGAQCKNNIRPTYLCTFELPKNIIPKNFYITNLNKCIVLPYGRLQAKNLLEYELPSGRFCRFIYYPDTLKYYFISPADDYFWSKLKDPNLFCYDFIFSYRQIYTDLKSNELFYFVYCLLKGNDSSRLFTPQKVIFSLKENVYSIYLLSSTKLFLAPLGITPIKGDTIVMYAILKDSSNPIKEYICLYDFKNEIVTSLIEISKIQNRKIRKQFLEIPHIYYIDDTSIVIYRYGQALPYVYSINESKFKRFIYSGKLKSLNSSNFTIYKTKRRLINRIFLHKFLPNSQYITIVGGKNIVNKKCQTLLKEIVIQQYSKKTLTFLSEYLINLPFLRKYSSFDCFVSPLNQSQIFLFLIRKDNFIDVYHFNI